MMQQQLSVAAPGAGVLLWCLQGASRSTS